MEKVKTKALFSIFCLIGLSACDSMLEFGEHLGFEPAEQKTERQFSEGKAVGNACRHAGRAIEDCYSIYNWLPKAGIFEGWLAMDQYMREHSLQPVEPLLPPPQSPNKKRSKKKKTAEESQDDSTLPSANADSD